jgi:site-specific recombinase XerD
VTDLERAVARASGLDPKTKATYLRRVKTYVEHVGSNSRHWTAKSVEAWLDQMRWRGLKSQTVNVYLTAIKFASRARALHGNGPDFAARVQRIKFTEPAPGEPVTWSERKRLFETATGPSPVNLRDRAMIALALQGLRREEICGLIFDAIEEGSVRRKKRRRLGIDPAAEKVLRTWIAWLRDQGVVSGKVFRSLRASIEGGWHIGRSMSGQAFTKMLAKRSQEAGIMRVCPDALRAAAAARKTTI